MFIYFPNILTRRIHYHNTEARARVKTKGMPRDRESFVSKSTTISNTTFWFMVTSIINLAIAMLLLSW